MIYICIRIITKGQVMSPLTMKNIRPGPHYYDQTFYQMFGVRQTRYCSQINI